MQTTRTASGAMFEMGPRSVRFVKSPESRWVVSLLDELGLSNQILARNKGHPSAKYRKRSLNIVFTQSKSDNYRD